MPIIFSLLPGRVARILTCSSTSCAQTPIWRKRMVINVNTVVWKYCPWCLLKYHSQVATSSRKTLARPSPQGAPPAWGGCPVLQSQPHQGAACARCPQELPSTSSPHCAAWLPAPPALMSSLCRESTSCSLINQTCSKPVHYYCLNYLA